MANYYIYKKIQYGENAGAKAPEDICTICGNLGWERIDLPVVTHTDSSVVKKEKVMLCTAQWTRLLLKVKKGDIVTMTTEAGKDIKIEIISID